MVNLNFSSLTTCMWSVSKFFQFYVQINPSLPPPSLVQVSTNSHLNQHNRLLGGLFHSSLPQSIFHTVEAQVRPWRSCTQNAPVVLIPAEQQIPYKHLQNLAWFGLPFPLSVSACLPGCSPSGLTAVPQTHQAYFHMSGPYTCSLPCLAIPQMPIQLIPSLLQVFIHTVPS